MSNVKEVMTDSCSTLTLLDNVYEAAVLMKQQDIGFVPIVDQGRVVGVVTDRDIVIRGVAEKHPNSAHIRDVMTEHIISVRSNMSVDEAAEVMAEHQVRRLPVIDDGQLVGVVSLGDLAVRRPLADEAGQALSEISESPYTH
ncbi:CBS domain-containing protein [Paenibacillus taiwanensis]|uniref:CBS domain-containing protein n=1 Tax=Paenibacillus taiwanensis TaxID=401638 RepID=UPI0003FF788F|nr:CBS domain-containing protein [Paenibacillus taiwanensis]